MTRVAALLALLLLIPGISGARIDQNPVRIRLAGAPQEVEAGAPFRGSLLIEVGVTTALDDLRFTSPAWSGSLESIALPPVLQPGTTYELPFTLTSFDPDQPLALSWNREGESATRNFDLSREAWMSHRGEMATVYEDESALVAGRGFTPPWQVHPLATRSLDELRRLGAFEAQDIPRAQALKTIQVIGTVKAAHPRWSTGTVPIRSCMVVVNAWDEAGHYLGLPAVANTGSNGEFIIDVNWNWATNPNLQITMYSANEYVEVEKSDWMEATWQFQSPVYSAVPGNSLSAGILMPSRELTHGAFYISEVILRGAEYMATLGYDMHAYDGGQIGCQWSDSGGSRYNPYWEEMHLAPGHAWSEQTILHEYGHHWNFLHAMGPDFSYCNQVCDLYYEAQVVDCGHCLWCEESSAVAWIEGIANFFSRICTDEISQTYSSPPRTAISTMAIATLGTDDRCPTVQDPQVTEGFFAALLYDLADYEPYEDDPMFPGYQDRIRGALDETLATLKSYTQGIQPPYLPCGERPDTPQEFLDCFLARYPEWKEEFWETAMNNGYDVDYAPPGVVTGLFADPPHGLLGYDPTIQFWWTRAEDDVSGTAGYAITMSQDAPVDPGTYQDIGDVTTWTSSPRSSGTWYFTIRARDRAGRWSPDYATLGPFHIGTAAPADLQPVARAGWDYRLVPRSDNTATVMSAQVSTTLYGGQANTWWSISGENTGTAASPACLAAVYVDGEIVDDTAWISLGPGTKHVRLNEGPITVDAGRHIFGMFLDSDEQFLEPGENDNYWAGQWVWRPETLPGSGMSQFDAPPPATGGFEFFGFQQPLYYNCRGHRIEESIHFAGVWMHSQVFPHDYDLRLFASVATAENGFDTPLAVSERPGSVLEAVFVNPLNAGHAAYNVGVLNVEYDADDSEWGFADYEIGRREAQFIGNAYGQYPGVLHGDDDVMHIYTFQPESASGGHVTFSLEETAGQHPVHLAFFGPDFTVGGLLDADAFLTADPQGGANPDAVDVYVPPGQVAAVVVWFERGVYGSEQAQYTLGYQRSLPDPAAWKSPQWASAVVPQPDASIGAPYASVPAPDHLDGDVQNTWIYFAESNGSPIPCPSHDVSFYVDGELITRLHPSNALTANTTRLDRTPGAVSIRGGRHALTMELDDEELLAEIREQNNHWGAQWAWSPTLLAFGSRNEYPPPPDPTGGWEFIVPPPTHLNCAGFRSPDLNRLHGRFALVGILETGDSDHDLRLHEMDDDPVEAFGQILSASSMVESGPEYFVFAGTSGPERVHFDLGVVRQEGSDSFLMQAVESDGEVLGVPCERGFELDAGDLFALHEILLPAGEWNFELFIRPGGERVDLGFALQPTRVAFSTREDALPLGASWEAGPGEAESFSVIIDDPDTYPLAVYRNSKNAAEDPLVYILRVTERPTGVEDGLLPGTTRILSAAPNPFSNSTSLRFDLPTAGPVDISVFDVKGRLVRRLRAEPMGAGRHAVEWDGRDEAGSRVASGIYHLKLRTNDHEAVRKVVLVN